MSYLAALIAETASIQQQIESDADRARRKGLKVTETDGSQWRVLAACKRELDVLTGKAELLDELMRQGIAASECRRRWDELETKRLEGSKVDVAVTG